MPVSILTRPYGRMLLRPAGLRHTPILFQSSPALTGGCYVGHGGTRLPSQRFNPHPPLRADAIKPEPELYIQGSGFNPHPPLRADAIRVGWQLWRQRWFQSSPALTGGCYWQSWPDPLEPFRVSILTRPYGRMLYDAPIPIPAWAMAFQSSPALTGGCYAEVCVTWFWIKCFNPHPPLRADAILSAAESSCACPMFQSSPALTGGCYMAQSRIYREVEDRFNPHPPLRADAITTGRSFLGCQHRFNPHPPLRADAIQRLA